MTAPDTNRVESDNSTPRPAYEGRTITPTRDPRLRRIVEHANKNNASTTERDIATKAGWTLRETREYLQRLEADNLVQLIQSGNTRIALLTERGEQFARGEL